jgi:hypothetical protein
MRGKGLLLVRSGNRWAQEVQGTFVKVLTFFPVSEKGVYAKFLYIHPNIYCTGNRFFLASYL